MRDHDPWMFSTTRTRRRCDCAGGRGSGTEEELTGPSGPASASRPPRSGHTDPGECHPTPPTARSPSAVARAAHASSSGQSRRQISAATFCTSQGRLLIPRTRVLRARSRAQPGLDRHMAVQNATESRPPYAVRRDSRRQPGRSARLVHGAVAPHIGKSNSTSHGRLTRDGAGRRDVDLVRGLRCRIARLGKGSADRSPDERRGALRPVGWRSRGRQRAGVPGTSAQSHGYLQVGVGIYEAKLLRSPQDGSYPAPTGSDDLGSVARS